MKCIMFLIVLFWSLGLSAQKQKTILGIFPHPDDENIIGDVFAKYARLGHNVYIIIIGGAGKGGTRVTSIPAGDSLGTLRRQETICACEKLGVHPPIFLPIENLNTSNGVRNYLNDHKKILAELKKYIIELKPDVLITFGPDGEYGHPDHIIAGATVTDLLLREGWVDKYPLYFPVEFKEEVTDAGDNSFVDKQYANASVSYLDEDEQKSFEAAKCYKTQYTPDEIKELIEKKSAEKRNTKYFRRVSVKKGMKKELF